jgi:hypothetical protein
VFDDEGKLVEQGWVRNGMLASDMQKTAPQPGDPGR